MPELLVTAVLAAACTGGGSQHHKAGPSPSTTRTTVAPTSPALTSTRAHQLSVDLGSGKLQQLTDSVALPTGARVARSAAAQLKALTPIRFDLASFRRSGSDAAIVSADTARGRFVVYLVLTKSRWMIAATEPAR